MSTRSFIGLELEGGRVLAVYCHFDGYPEGGVGQTLAAHWTTRSQVEELLSYGDISVLGPELGEAHEFPHYVDSYCTFYIRDAKRPIAENSAAVYESRRAFLLAAKLSWAEWAYLLTLGQTVMTAALGHELRAAGLEVPTLFPYIERYTLGDWGSYGTWAQAAAAITDNELTRGPYATDEPAPLNLVAMLNGIDRLIASYQVDGLGELWIITEANREATTLLLPEDY